MQTRPRAADLTKMGIIAKHSGDYSAKGNFAYPSRLGVPNHSLDGRGLLLCGVWCRLAGGDRASRHGVVIASTAFLISFVLLSALSTSTRGADDTCKSFSASSLDCWSNSEFRQGFFLLLFLPSLLILSCPWHMARAGVGSHLCCGRRCFCCMWCRENRATVVWFPGEPDAHDPEGHSARIWHRLARCLGRWRRGDRSVRGPDTGPRIKRSRYP